MNTEFGKGEVLGGCLNESVTDSEKSCTNENGN